MAQESNATATVDDAARLELLGEARKSAEDTASVDNTALLAIVLEEVHMLTPDSTDAMKDEWKWLTGLVARLPVPPQNVLEFAKARKRVTEALASHFVPAAKRRKAAH